MAHLLGRIGVSIDDGAIALHLWSKAAENLRWGSGFGTPQDDVNEWMSEAGENYFV